jgi:hypothetical protein
MGTILGIIAGIAVLFFIMSLLFSNKAAPEERIEEAVASAGAGALFSAGCMFQAIMAALPILLGIALINLIMGGC